MAKPITPTNAQPANPRPASPHPDRPHPDSPRARLWALPEERRAQLLDPAETEFAAHGFAAASLNRILASAGMSKGQAYYYIADKADLYGAVMERAFQRFVTALDFTFGAPVDARAFWKRVEALFVRISTVLIEHPTLACLARSFYESETSRHSLPQSFIRDRFDGLIALGQSLGAVREDMPASLLKPVLFTMALETDRWFAENWQDLDESEARRLNGAALQMFRAMASPPP
ncbi:TetR/AcrR family transcriptional regulator [Altericroceibacterium spongiae]|nr:TetR/AcrR family transcriptional regulator [Altericroceibacterium spongiae]